MTIKKHLILFKNQIHILKIFLNLPLKIHEGRDFPSGTVVKNPPANAGDMGSIPGPGTSHMPRNN